MNNPLLGTWKLQSFTTEYQDTGQKTEPYGTRPSGYLSYGADGRMYVIVVGESRKPPTAVVPTNAETIALFNGMAAYAGTYTIEGDMVSHHVGVSWIEAWTGTTQDFPAGTGSPSWDRKSQRGPLTAPVKIHPGTTCTPLFDGFLSPSNSAQRFLRRVCLLRRSEIE